MADITIKVDKAASDKFLDKQSPPKEPQAKTYLQARRTLNGDVLIFDHHDVDIVIMPEKKKIVALSKDLMGDHVYGSQNRLFDFLMKKGIIVYDSVQGGNVYGSLEATMQESQDADPVQAALFSVGKFIEEEAPYFEMAQQYEDELEDSILEPSDEESTDYETAVGLHEPEKGSIKPGYLYGLARYRLYRG